MSNKHKHGVQKHAREDPGGGGWVEGITALGDNDAATRLLHDQESAVASVIALDAGDILTYGKEEGEGRASVTKDEDFDTCLEYFLGLLIKEVSGWRYALYGSQVSHEIFPYILHSCTSSD